MEKAEEQTSDFFSQIEEQKDVDNVTHHDENKVAPIEIKCIGAEKVKIGEYVLYHLQVTVGNKTILIKKRFSDILRDLHTPVGKPRHVNGPSRHVFESFQGQNMDFIKGRAKEIENYCIELLKIPGVQTDPVFVNFFQLYNLEDKQMALKRLSQELEKAKEYAKKQNVPIQFVDAKTAVIVKVETPQNADNNIPHISLTSSFKGISFKDDAGTSPRSPRPNDGHTNATRTDRSNSNVAVRTDRSNSNVATTGNTNATRTDRSNSNVAVRTDRATSTNASKLHSPMEANHRKKSLGNYPGGVNGPLF
jgi:hypothetical protein